MKKGFTLVELLAIFSIMASIMLLSIPSITSMLKKAEESKIKTFEENVFLAAEAYISGNRDNYQELREQNKLTYVEIDKLLNTYLNSNLITPNILGSKQIKDVKNNLLILVKANENYVYEYKMKYLSDKEMTEVNNALVKMKTMENNKTTENINNAQSAINSISEEEIKEAFQNRLNYIK